MTRPRIEMVTEGDRPSRQSYKFGNKWLNLSAIARTQGIEKSHLSKFFGGKADLHTNRILAVAAAIGMEIGEFMTTLVDHINERRALERATYDQYIGRITAEDRANLNRIRRGKAPIPSLPGLRD